jgi:large subunit ribosomal protein L11
MGLQKRRSTKLHEADMAKEVKGYIKLQIPAGKANPAPPIGPALGQAGVNIMDFCKKFNAETQKIEAGTPIPVVISVYKDRSFTFITKQPPVSYYLKKAAKLKKGASETGKSLVGKVTMTQIREIAKDKMVDMNANDIDAACRMIAGSAVSMGIQVDEAA